MEGSYIADDGIHHKRKQYTFTGNETFVKSNENNNYIRLYSPIFADVIKTSGYETIDKFMCTHFERIEDYSNSKNCIALNEKRFYITISKNIVTDVKTFKTWLSQNHVTVEYELAEPETVPYTAEQQEAWNNLQNIASFEGKNYIITDPYGIYIKIEYSFGVTKEKIYDIYSSTKFALQSEQESDVGYIWNDSSVWDNTKYWWFPKENLDSKQFKITILPTSSSILEVE